MTNPCIFEAGMSSPAISSSNCQNAAPTCKTHWLRATTDKIDFNEHMIAVPALRIVLHEFLSVPLHSITDHLVQTLVHNPRVTRRANGSPFMNAFDVRQSKGSESRLTCAVPRPTSPKRVVQRPALENIYQTARSRVTTEHVGTDAVAFARRVLWQARALAC